MSEMTRVTLDITGGLAVVTLAQPPVNALDRALIAELMEALDEVRRSEDARAVLITGGRKVFAAGGDVKEMLGWDYRRAVRDSAALSEACTALSRLPMPVIAAINGFALGGGCELALSADLRVCATDSKLGFPEILLGVIPGAGGTQRLPRLVGPARAKDLIFSGRMIGGPEALAIGLVDHVVEPDLVLEKARELAAPYLNGPAMALRAAKEAIDRGLEVSLDTGLELERGLFAGLFATEDRMIGMTSFVEKGVGKAEFVGR
ncbi:enoyl-CoA hydratase/isomerase family protein [Sphaerimonospora sp. CA-214678]|uniref:enoyl-CoA hydratase/isomerase family protein n=1 Tax=Sphaerimonospora sp. CA-214678 TaxID=3240029 RepID=UPI003D8C5B47